MISNPCSENWDSMQADAVGRFCQSCQKSVIDFTSKSDDQIKEFLKDKQGERLCGRFHIHQVERIRIEIDPNLLISGIPFWQKFWWSFWFVSDKISWELISYTHRLK